MAYPRAWLLTRVRLVVPLLLFPLACGTPTSVDQVDGLIDGPDAAALATDVASTPPSDASAAQARGAVLASGPGGPAPAVPYGGQRLQSMQAVAAFGTTLSLGFWDRALQVRCTFTAVGARYRCLPGVPVSVIVGSDDKPADDEWYADAACKEPAVRMGSFATRGALVHRLSVLPCSRTFGYYRVGEPLAPTTGFHRTPDGCRREANTPALDRLTPTICRASSGRRL